MTDPTLASTNTRLTRLEDEFETVKQLLVSAASYAESANRRIDRLSDRQDATQRQLDGLAVTVQIMGEKIDGLTVTVGELNHKIDDFIETTTARNSIINNVILELRDGQQSVNAAIERLDAILLKLIERDVN
jgi:chromosome segregation ATPase